MQHALEQREIFKEGKATKVQAQIDKSSMTKYGDNTKRLSWHVCSLECLYDVARHVAVLHLRARHMYTLTFYLVQPAHITH